MEKLANIGIEELNDLIALRKEEVIEGLGIEPYKKLNARLRSQVWNYFGMAYINTALGRKYICREIRFCINCLQEYREGLTVKIANYWDKTATDNLASHLKEEHNISVESKMPPGLSQSSTPTIDRFLSSSSKISSSPLTPRLPPFNNHVLDATTELYATLPTMSMNIIDSNEFKSFANRISNKKIDIPSRNTLRKSVVSLYERGVAAVKDFLKVHAPYVIGISIDLGSENSAYKRSYFNVQAQFSNDFEVYNINLHTAVFDDEKTSEALAKELEQVLQSFGLHEKYIVILRDQGANVKKCCRLLFEKNVIKGDHLSCVAHILHLIIGTDLFKKIDGEGEKLKALLSKLKKIHQKLCYKLQSVADKTKELETLKGLQSLAEEDFETALMFLNEKNNIFPTDNGTRWTSTERMFASVQKNLLAIEDMLQQLNERDLRFTTEEVMLLDDLVEILGCFKIATTTLQGQSFGTLHQALLFDWFIRKEIDSLREKVSHLVRTTVIPCILEGMDSRLQFQDIHKVAAILNPRFQRKVNLNVAAKSNLLLFWLELFNIEYETQDIQIAESVNDSEDIISQILDKYEEENLVEEPVLRSKKSRMSEEIEMYFNLKITSGDVKSFWIKNKLKYPALYKLADYLFGIPATSASSESNFSLLGMINNSKAATIKSDLTKAKIFICANKFFLMKRGILKDSSEKSNDPIKRRGRPICLSSKISKMQEKKDQEKENNREKTVPEENNNVILDLEDDFIEDCYEDYLKESLPEENYEEIIIHPPFD